MTNQNDAEIKSLLSQLKQEITRDPQQIAQDAKRRIMESISSNSSLTDAEKQASISRIEEEVQSIQVPEEH